MPYLLNPRLVEERVFRDPAYPFHEQYVFLRDPKPMPVGTTEVGIGKVVLADKTEDAELATELKGEDSALSALGSDETLENRRVFRTNGAFGYSNDDSVVLVVDSAADVFVETQDEPSGLFEDATIDDWMAISANRANRTLLVKKTTAGIGTDAGSPSTTKLRSEHVEYPPSGMGLMDSYTAQLLVGLSHDLKGHWDRFTILVYRNGGRILYKEVDSATLEALIVFP